MEEEPRPSTAPQFQTNSLFNRADRLKIEIDSFFGARDKPNDGEFLGATVNLKDIKTSDLVSCRSAAKFPIVYDSI